MGNIAKIIAYLKEHGSLLTISYIVSRLYCKIFNASMKKIFKVNKIYVHPSARIINAANITIGENFVAGKGLWLEAVREHGTETYSPRIVIGNNVALSEYVHIGATKYVEIGNNVLMASKIYISDHNHGQYSGDSQTPPSVPPNERPVSAQQQVIIKDNVWLGEMVSVLPGVTIGEGSIVACNSVVTKDVPSATIVAGSPAKAIKRYDNSSERWIAF